MGAELKLIQTAYEQEGLSPEEIADCQGLELTAVKAGLMSVSSVYRKACGQEDEKEETLNFSNDQLKQVNEVIFETALAADDPYLRFKAATYVRDDKKGRKEVVKNVQNAGINIFMINEKLKQIRAVKETLIPKALVNV